MRRKEGIVLFRKLLWRYELVSVLVMCFPSPENSVAQSSSLKIAQLASQCCSRGQMGCSTATVPASVHFIVACVVYYLNDPVSASCEVFVVSSVVASRLATAFLTGN